MIWIMLRQSATSSTPGIISLIFVIILIACFYRSVCAFTFFHRLFQCILKSYSKWSTEPFSILQSKHTWVLSLFESPWSAVLHWTCEKGAHPTLLSVSEQRHTQRHLSQAAGGVVHGQLFLYLSPWWPVRNRRADGESILNALLSLFVLKWKAPFSPPCWAIDLLLVDFLVVTSIDGEERETDRNDQQEADGQLGALTFWFIL